MKTGNNKCPYCNASITSLEVDDVDLMVNFAPRWKGFSYGCPSCHKTISVQMNPLTLQTDIADEVVERIGRK
jgi:transposase-like protein